MEMSFLLKWKNCNVIQTTFGPTCFLNYYHKKFHV